MASSPLPSRSLYRQPCPTGPRAEPRKNHSVITKSPDGSIVDLKSLSAYASSSCAASLDLTRTSPHQSTKTHPVQSIEDIRRKFSEEVKQRKENARVESSSAAKGAVKKAEQKGITPQFSRPEPGRSIPVIARSADGSIVDFKKLSANTPSSSNDIIKHLRNTSRNSYLLSNTPPCSTRTLQHAEDIRREFFEMVRHHKADARQEGALEQKAQSKRQFTSLKGPDFEFDVVFPNSFRAGRRFHYDPESQIGSATATPVLDNLRYDSGEYCLQKCLNRGGYGIVTSVSHRDIPGSLFAQKQISKSKVDYEDFLNEVKLTREARHRHVISVFDTYQDHDFYYFVMEPVATCNLEQYMQNMNSLRQQALDWKEFGNMRLQLFKFIPCLAATLKALHDRRIRHRDIKPENILIHDQHIILTDFGTSFITQDVTRAGSTKTLGTDKFEPPEAFTLQRDGSSRPTKMRTGRPGDMFSLGCVFYEIVEAMSVHVALPPATHSYAAHFRDDRVLQQIKTYREQNALVSKRLHDAHRLPGLVEGILQIILSIVTLSAEQRKDVSFVSEAVISVYNDYSIARPECCAQGPTDLV